MSEKPEESTQGRLELNRVLDAPLLGVDLNAYLQQIKSEKAWKDSDRNAITVCKTRGMSIVLFALHEGAELKKHTAQGVISVQVLDGKIRFDTDQESLERTKGQMLMLHEKIPHRVLALEEAVFLLTIATLRS